MKINKILYPTDLSECGMLALDYVLYLAKKYTAEVDILYVDEPTYLIKNPYSPAEPSSLTKHVDRVSEILIGDMIKKSFGENISAKRLHRIGKPYKEIVDAAKEERSDIVVMGTHGNSGMNMFLGSNAERVARLAPCPVITVRQKQNFNGFQKIIFPIDFSSLCKTVLPEVVEFARSNGSELRLVHIVPKRPSVSDDEFQGRFQMFLKDTDTTGVVFKTEIHHAASSGAGILSSASKKESDMIMIPTHGYTGLKRVLIGSVATEIVNESDIPVMVLRSFKS